MNEIVTFQSHVSDDILERFGDFALRITLGEYCVCFDVRVITGELDEKDGLWAYTNGK